jgi:hypothetical protein
MKLPAREGADAPPGRRLLMNSLDDPNRPLPALTLTIETAGAPTVQLTYDPDRPIQETAVTLLDQLSGTRACTTAP